MGFASGWTECWPKSFAADRVHRGDVALADVLRAMEKDILVDGKVDFHETEILLNLARPLAAFGGEYAAFRQALEDVREDGVVTADESARIASLLKTLNIYVRGGIRLTEKGEPDFDYYLLPLAELGRDEASCVCMALPFLRGGDYPAGMTPEEGLRFFFEEMHRCLKRSDFAGLPVVAAAHFYAAGASVCEGEHSERLVVGGQDCVDARVVGKGVAYTALGHLHKAQQVAGCPDVCYAGSALPMSFAERGYRHGAQWVELDETGQACVSRIEYNPLRHLMCIPTQGTAASVSEVFDEIAQLPRRAKGDDGADWPYLEIRLEEKQPEPTLQHEVCEALADRAVHLCRLLRVRPESPAAPSSGPQPERQALDPLLMANLHFKARYGEAMPEALAERFRQAAQEAEEDGL